MSSQKYINFVKEKYSTQREPDAKEDNIRIYVPIMVQPVLWKVLSNKNEA